ncbi:hypothetical protein GCM10011519_27230 [Marmoricola endophyticus]|uniref:Spore protein YkvP/CgeB glycosyl transferase-like domain-containing protein n=1 Tax=Marmoricola endophyticus TaxID=2040280 RepID=A0A917BPK1_9ACTN|nr:glycosyltransferase [Marmoricola endophyticus]GGF51769.1 hypothetical protein GCM10011519_27230 [Marmoricola endophyticus]
MSRLLLVTPTFHGYGTSIADALRRRGHEVAEHRYDDVGPVRKKLRYELPERLGRTSPEQLRAEITARTVARLRAERPEVVLVVKGDVLGEDFWGLLDERRLPRVLWLYDELARMAHPLDRLGQVGPVASYSPHDVARLDAAGVPARHLPLAHDPYVAHGAVREREDVVFVGARYPRREELLLGLQAAGVAVTAYGRDWSRHPVDRLRTWGGARPALPTGRDLDRPAAYAAMAGARGALNVHGDQDGFTMRTFEACGVGGLQLIDRSDVGELYEPGEELLVFHDLEHLVELLTRARTDAAWAERVRRRGAARTLAEHTVDHRVAVLEELWSTWG